MKIYVNTLEDVPREDGQFSMRAWSGMGVLGWGV